VIISEEQVKELRKKAMNLDQFKLVRNFFFLIKGMSLNAR
jgi:hypothetical protein